MSNLRDFVYWRNSSNDTSSSTIFLVPTPATVSGTVRSDTGEPIINASVRILDQNEFVLGTIVTDEFGNYSLTDLPQGNQEIIVSAPDLLHSSAALF
ncbi:carboxypeptidase regulatory-like domain-containing protein [Bacillus megaterium]|nr:carboxypeptidase regulatory-like domain-containing protein [Priestia megaterium]